MTTADALFTLGTFVAVAVMLWACRTWDPQRSRWDAVLDFWGDVLDVVLRRHRVFHGPRWEQQALAVAANLSDEEWNARRELGVPLDYPEHIVPGNPLAWLERELWPNGEYVGVIEEHIREQG